MRLMLGPVHRVAVAAELAAERLADALRAGVPQEAPHVTAIVKTFERPRVLDRLLRSLRRHYPGLAVIVADDSRSPRHVEGVEYIHLDHDSGVGTGRKVALDRVSTPYVLVLDDDFVFYRHTRLESALDALERCGDIDIVGGTVVNLPRYRVTDYREAPLYPTTAAPVHLPGTLLGGLPVYDKVPNFYVARTDRLRLVGFDPQIKRIDHADFFTRARGVLTTVYCAPMRVLHARTPFDRAYMAKRLDIDADSALLGRRWG